MDFAPELPSVFWKSGRLKTFQNWPYDSSNDVCNSERMATAGFVAIGNKDEPDLVECFVCGKQLDGWEPTDDPWEEHCKHEPSCSFVKLHKQNELDWTISELFDMIKVFYMKNCQDKLEKSKVQLKQEASRLAEQVPEIYKGLRKARRRIS